MSVEVQGKKPYIVTVFSTKGGVGKSTIAAIMAAMLGDLSQRVLVIDADPQGSLTKFFIDDTPTDGVADVLRRASNGGVLVPSDIVSSHFAGVDFVPSNLSETTQEWIRTQEAAGLLLRTALDCETSKEYDFIIIDSQGSKGQLQRSAALAADVILSPVPPDMINFSELLTGTLQQVRQLAVYTKFIPDLKPANLKVVINRMEQTIIAREVANALAETLQGQDVELLGTQIDRATAFNVAMSSSKPLHASAPSSKSVVQMLALINELFPWVDTSALAPSNAANAGAQE
jgi:chromosome partitioning related protein ParA